MKKHRSVLFIALASIVFLACLSALWPKRVLDSGRELILQSASIPAVLPTADHHMDMYETGAGLITSSAVVAPENMWITTVESTVKNGPPALLHHLAIVRLDRPNPICGLKYRNQPVYMTSSESPMMLTGKEAFPAPYAIFVPKGTPLMIRAMFSDAEPPKGPGGVYSDVSLEIRLKYDTDAPKHLPIEYNHVVLTEKDCAVNSDLPAHSKLVLKGDRSGKTQNGAYRFANDGEIVATRGHFHPWEGGKSMTLSLNGKALYVFTPYLASAEPWSWKINRYAQKIPIKKGDVLTIDVAYDNDTNTSFTDAMAMLGFYFIPKQY